MAANCEDCGEWSHMYQQANAENKLLRETAQRCQEQSNTDLELRRDTEADLEALKERLKVVCITIKRLRGALLSAKQWIDRALDHKDPGATLVAEGTETDGKRGKS